MSNYSKRDQLTLLLCAGAVFVFMVGVISTLIIEQYAKVHQVYATYQEHAETDRKNTSQEIARTCQGLGGVDFTTCITDKLKTYHRDQATNQDLQAQQDMAFWAMWVVWVGLGTIVVTVTGVYLIWRTLHYTAEAARFAAKTLGEAEVATRAAEEAVNVSRETAKVELRAYLSAEPGGINQLIGEHGIIGLVVVQNVGKLPAQKVAVTVHMMISDKEDFEPPEFGDLEPSDRTIQPGAEMTQGSPATLNASSLDCYPQQWVFVAGLVEYLDGYNKLRHTRFCHRYAIESRTQFTLLDGLPKETRCIIDSDKARYHENGNEAD